MPRYLHIPHSPDTARTQTLSGRNCLVVSGMTSSPSLKSATGAWAQTEPLLCVHSCNRRRHPLHPISFGDGALLYASSPNFYIKSSIFLKKASTVRCINGSSSKNYPHKQ